MPSSPAGSVAARCSIYSLSRPSSTFQMRWVGRHAGFRGKQRCLLENMFLLVRQLESGMIDDLDAVIAIRIVRRRNHDAGRKRSGARDVRDARSGDQPREIAPRRRGWLARPPHASAIAGPDSRVSIPITTSGQRVVPAAPARMIFHPLRQRHAHCERRSGVERVLSRDAAHPVGSKKLSQNFVIFLSVRW